MRTLVRTLLRPAAGAIAAQGVTALGSLLLQVLAVRTLGEAGYGALAVLIGFLATVAALQTGWIGDSLTVLDRTDLRVRGALAFCLLSSCLIGAAAGSALVAGVNLGPPATAVLFAVLVALWLLEETGRRLLMARLEFWKLALNDAVYLGVSLSTLALLAALRTVTLATFLAAMLAGAASAVALVLWQVPRGEYLGLRPRWRGVRDLASFAAWRSAQATLRPGALFVMRLLVVQVLSTAALGRLEAARLLVAPAQTLVNGAGSFLLPTFADGEREGRDAGSRADRAALVLLAATLLTGLVVLAALPLLAELITGDPGSISRLAVVGWVAYLVTWAATLPYVSEVVARRRSRSVFVVRVIDSVVGLALLPPLLLIGRDATLVPLLLSFGGAIGALLMRRLAVRSRPPPTGDATGDPGATAPRPHSRSA